MNRPISKATERISYRIQQVQSSLRLEGWFSTGTKTAAFLFKKLLPTSLREIKLPRPKTVKDLLFVNGCHLDHCRRYRVLHPMEQLISLGLECDETPYETLKMEELKFYRGFIFYRTPITPLIQEFIQEGKKQNKTFFFDIDDLVMDQKYTDSIPYLKSLPPSEKDLYDSGVRRMQETLKLCDAAITTTPSLARELKQWQSDVFVNLNVASDQMVALAEAAYAEHPAESRSLVLGYLSGSITHNSDFEMIAPALARIMAEEERVTLKVIGLIDLPSTLEPYRHRVVTVPLMNWKKLPETLATLDINLAPLEDSLFNSAKSENRWMESAWMRLPTLASKTGRLLEMIRPDVDGYLVENTSEAWYVGLKALVNSPEKRRAMGQRAYEKVRQEYHTLKTGLPLKEFILSRLRPNVGFVLTLISPRGGVQVVIQHAHLLKKKGMDVTLFSEALYEGNLVHEGDTLHVISLRKSKLAAQFHLLVGTLWSTTERVQNYNRALHKSYLVQNYEVDFRKAPDSRRRQARLTYQLPEFRYLTISRWCQEWLESDYGIKARFAPNGIDPKKFTVVPRDFSQKKWRILIEGNSLDPAKNVDESFRIVAKLPSEEFEIWYLSYDGKPKSWYRVDRLFHQISHSQVAEIYQQCHVLVKTSVLESFSYPPLEMMATGGLVVVRANGGNAEYLRHEKNCLRYENDDWQSGVEYLKKLKNESALRETLVTNGIQTAQERQWDRFEDSILNLYQEDIRNDSPLKK